jgi:hypothetical protein
MVPTDSERIPISKFIMIIEEQTIVKRAKKYWT